MPPALTVIVADAGPLIGMTRIGRIGILRSLFQRIVIPAGVEVELRLESSRPGSNALAEARDAGWLTTESVSATPAHLLAAVDRGEAEAITLAKRLSLPLLIDERWGRTIAGNEGVRTIGTGGVLVRAKEKGSIPKVKPELNALRQAGYRLSESLCAEILRLAGE